MINKKYYDSMSLRTFVFTMESPELQQREMILLKHTENPLLSYRALAKLLKYPQSTVCSVLKKFRERFTVERKSGTGGKQDVRHKKKKPGFYSFLTQIRRFRHGMSLKRYKCHNLMYKK